MGDRGSSATLRPTTGDAEPVRPAPHGGDLDKQIIDAARSLVARWGIAKTTVGDIAREAQCSRATVYRSFPGGKQQVMRTLGQAELAQFFDHLAELADASDDLESALTAVILASITELGAHESFQFMLEHEPGLVLPFLGFHRIDRLYSAIRGRLGPHFTRFVGTRADWAVEWAARVALSYVFQPSPFKDMTDPDTVRTLVRTRLLPGLTANRTDLVLAQGAP